MSRLLIFGSEGQMGQAAQWAARELYGRENVFTCDITPRYNDTTHFVLSERFNLEWIVNSVKPNLVLSCLPYHKNLELATECISRKIFYADLGGSVPVSAQINNIAKTMKSPVFTDLGLAPGLVNIVTQEMVAKHKPDSVVMYCGGLPLYPQNPPYNYYSNWSVDGLLNEYLEDSIMLNDGLVTTVPGLSSIIPVSHNFCGELEAFPTSGGIAHSIDFFKKHNVQNAGYMTMRYEGHVYAINKNLHSSKRETLAEILKPSSRYRDVVLIKIQLDIDSLDKNMTFDYVERDITIHWSGRFSAMQRATAFSAIAGLKSLVEPNPYTTMDHWPRPYTYEDINYGEFMRQFNNLLEKDLNEHQNS